MATVEDIIKVLEENGVPMTLEQIMQEANINTEWEIRKLLPNDQIYTLVIQGTNKGIKYRDEEYLEQNPEADSTYEGDVVVYSKELFWSKSDFHNYTKLIAKNYIRESKDNKFSIKSFVEHLSYTLEKYFLISNQEMGVELSMAITQKDPRWSQPLNPAELFFRILSEIPELELKPRSTISTPEDHIVYYRGKQEEESINKIHNFILELFRISKITKLDLTRLVFELNRYDLEVVFPKPYTKKLIIEIIRTFGKYYTIEKDAVVLIADLNLATSELLENTEALNDNLLKKSTSKINSILSLKFTGDEFLYEPAIEYVKLRKIISLIKIEDDKNYKGEAKTYLELIKDSELFNFLKKILKNDEEVMQWIKENTVAGEYSDTKNHIREIYPKLIEKFSPVFNLKNNPGNLFSFSLNELMKG